MNTIILLLALSQPELSSPLNAPLIEERVDAVSYGQGKSGVLMTFWCDGKAIEHRTYGCQQDMRLIHDGEDFILLWNDSHDANRLVRFKSLICCMYDEDAASKRDEFEQDNFWWGQQIIMRRFKSRP